MQGLSTPGPALPDQPAPAPSIDPRSIRAHGRAGAGPGTAGSTAGLSRGLCSRSGKRKLLEEGSLCNCSLAPGHQLLTFGNVFFPVSWPLFSSPAGFTHPSLFPCHHSQIKELRVSKVEPQDLQTKCQLQPSQLMAAVIRSTRSCAGSLRFSKGSCWAWQGTAPKGREIFPKRM